MSPIRQLFHEFGVDQRIFWRNPAAVFFTIALPVLLLLLLCAVSSSQPGSAAGTGLISVDVYVPAMITLGVAYAAFADLAIRLTMARERGTLKRVRSTPLPPVLVVCGRMATALVLATLLVILPTALGALLYGTALPGKLWLLVGTLVVAVPALAALGFALTIVIPSEPAAAPIANALLLPLFFASGLFIDSDVLPQALRDIAVVFPLQPLFELMTVAFGSARASAGALAADLAVIAAWGAVGLALALMRFRWVPQAQR